MTIRVDVSPSSAVVLCTDCPGWRELAPDRVEGRRIGLEHAATIHPGSRSHVRASSSVYAASQRRTVA